MRVVVLGLWHLGSVTAACTAAAGIPTVGIDDDVRRVEALARGVPPVFEPGLSELIGAGIDAGHLTFTSDIAAVAEADVLWACHDTPVDDDDRADVAAVTRSIEATFSHLKSGAVVLVSAQLPAGSVGLLQQSFDRQSAGRTVSFACSPENLRLGRAIEIFTHPGRIVIGVRDTRSRTVLEPLLARFCDRLIWMSVESAEMIKHAINAFLAVSVTFTNEIATLCERVGARASEVEAGLRSDPRIGPHAYVKAGPAFAGGTLARDVNFLHELARQHGVSVPVIDSIQASNRAHGQWALSQLRRTLKPLAGRAIGILGLAYKPGTNSTRRSASLDLIRALTKEGAKVRAYDPAVKELPDDLAALVTLASDAPSAARGAEALVVATEWPEFAALRPDEIAEAMGGRIVLDPGRCLPAAFATNARLSLISVGSAS
jgi:UDPglucose 6-dehydrogenase